MKKNLIILVAVLLTSTFAFAQSGNMFVTGHLGFNTNSSSTSAAGTTVDVPGGNSFDILAEFHYKITNNIAVGLGLDYERASNFAGYTPQNAECYNTSSMFSIVPSVIYGIKITDNFKYIPRLYVSIGFGGADSESTNADPIVTNTTDMTSFAIGVRPLSFEYGVNRRFALTMSFGDLYYGINTDTYNIGTVEVKDTYKGFHLDANYGASFGIRIYL